MFEYIYFWSIIQTRNMQGSPILISGIYGMF